MAEKLVGMLVNDLGCCWVPLKAGRWGVLAVDLTVGLWENYLVEL